MALGSILSSTDWRRSSGRPAASWWTILRPTRLALDSPAALHAFQWFVDLQLKEQVIPDAAAEAARDSESRFLDGTLGMYFNSRRPVPTLRTIETFDWDVAPLPATRDRLVFYIATAMFSRQEQRQGGSVEIHRIRQLSERPGNRRGHGPHGAIAAFGRRVGRLSRPTQKPVHSRVWLDAVPTLRAVPVISNWPAIEDAASKEVERAFYGQATVEERRRRPTASPLRCFSRNDAGVA